MGYPDRAPSKPRRNNHGLPARARSNEGRKMTTMSLTRVHLELFGNEERWLYILGTHIFICFSWALWSFYYPYSSLVTVGGPVSPRPPSPLQFCFRSGGLIQSISSLEPRHVHALTGAVHIHRPCGKAFVRGIKRLKTRSI